MCVMAYDDVDEALANDILQLVLSNLDHITQSDLVTGTNTKDSWLYPQASYRRMFVNQPPQTLQMVPWKRRWLHRWNNVVIELNGLSVTNEEGVKMSDILDGCQRLLKDGRQIAKPYFGARTFESYAQLADSIRQLVAEERDLCVDDVTTDIDMGRCALVV